MRTLVFTFYDDIDGSWEQHLAQGEKTGLWGRDVDASFYAFREVDWPSEADYGDFDENGWLRRDVP